MNSLLGNPKAAIEKLLTGGASALLYGEQGEQVTAQPRKPRKRGYSVRTPATAYEVCERNRERKKRVKNATRRAMQKRSRKINRHK